MDILRNLPVQQPAALSELISIQPGRVVSMALSRSYFGDTVYYVLEGDMPLRLEGHEVCLGAGDCLAVPAQTTHAIGGNGPFKLLQITIQSN